MAFVGQALERDWKTILNNYIITCGSLYAYDKTIGKYLDSFGGQGEMARILRAGAVVVTMEELREIAKRQGLRVSIF